MNRKTRNRLFRVIVLGGVGLTANLASCGGSVEPSDVGSSDAAGADGFPVEGPAQRDAFPFEGAADAGSSDDASDASDAGDALPDGHCFPIETAVVQDC
jgi:hypothetical protein